MNLPVVYEENVNRGNIEFAHRLPAFSRLPENAGSGRCPPARPVIASARPAEEQPKALNEQLEERIEQRTRQLEETNEKLRRQMSERRRLEREVLQVSEQQRWRIGESLHEEAVQHAVLHGEASEVAIELRVEDSEHILSVRDNGSGLEDSFDEGEQRWRRVPAHPVPLPPSERRPHNRGVKGRPRSP